MSPKKWVLNRSRFPGEIILCGQQQYTFGRAKENDHVLMSVYVSRRHCLFKDDGVNLSVVDLNSANGTFVNECRVNAHEAVTLKQSDVIGFGVSIDANIISNDFYVFTLTELEDKVPAKTDCQIQVNIEGELVSVKQEPVADLSHKYVPVETKDAEVEIISEKPIPKDIEVIELKDDEIDSHLGEDLRALQFPTGSKLLHVTSENKISQLPVTSNKREEESTDLETNKCNLVAVQTPTSGPSSECGDLVRPPSSDHIGKKLLCHGRDINYDTVSRSNDCDLDLLQSDSTNVVVAGVSKLCLTNRSDSEVVSDSGSKLLNLTFRKEGDQRETEFSDHNILVPKGACNQQLIPTECIKSEPSDIVRNIEDVVTINTSSNCVPLKSVSTPSNIIDSSESNKTSVKCEIKSEPETGPICYSFANNEECESPDKWFRTELLPYLKTLENDKNSFNDASSSDVHILKRKSSISSLESESLKKKIKLCSSSSSSIITSEERELETNASKMPSVMRPVVCDKPGENMEDEIRNQGSDDCKSTSDSKNADNMNVEKSEFSVLNYSQSDDAVFVVDDDDDGETSSSCVKDLKNDDVFIKQEMFEDDVEEEDDDDVMVIEWVNRLSQSLNVKINENDVSSEEDVNVSAVKKCKIQRLIISSDSSGDELDAALDKKTLPDRNRKDEPENDKFNDAHDLLFDNGFQNTGDPKMIAKSDTYDNVCLSESNNEKYELADEEMFDFAERSASSSSLADKNIANISVSDKHDTKVTNESTLLYKGGKCLKATVSKTREKNVESSCSNALKDIWASDEMNERLSGSSDDEIVPKKSKSYPSRKGHKISDKPEISERKEKYDYCTANLKNETNKHKVEHNLTESKRGNSSVSKSTTNRQILLCSPLPQKSRRCTTSVSDKAERKKSSNNKTEEFKTQLESTNRTTPGIDSSERKSTTRHKHRSKKPDSLEREKRDRDKEDRRKKLKAIAEKDKERESKSDSKITLPSKALVPVKNTKSTRADKLAELFAAPLHHSRSKSYGTVKDATYDEKKKERQSLKMKIKDCSETSPSAASCKSAFISSRKSNTASHNAKSADESQRVPSCFKSNAVVRESKSSKKKMFQGTGKHSSDKIITESVPQKSQTEVIPNIKKLSFKDLPKIPKRKDSSEIRIETDSILESAETRYSKLHKQEVSSIMKEPSKPLVSIVRTSNSNYQKKKVHFAPNVDLCSMKTFLIERGNKLRHVDAKDAPVKSHISSVREARSLFEVSSVALDRTVIQILRSWNPRWLKEQKEMMKYGDRPPPCFGASGDVSALVPMLTSFANYQEYIQIIHPLMMLDLWAEVSEDADRPTNRCKMKYKLTVEEYKEVNGITTLACQMPLCSNDERDQIHPRVGDLCQVFYPYWDQATSAEREKFVKEGKSPDDLLFAVFAYVDSVIKDYYQKGQNCNVFQGDTVFTPGNAAKFSGYVAAPVSCYLKLTIRMKTLKNFNYPVQFFKMQVVSNIRPSLRMFEAVAFLEHINLRQMILNPCIEDFRLPNTNIDFSAQNEGLDRSQKFAVSKAVAVCLQSKPKMCLIQGPPGTGKTKVIINIVKQILRPIGHSKVAFNRRPKILLCAPSNAGVDEIVERLLQIRGQMKKEDRFKMVRCGQFCSMRESVRGVSLEELVSKDIERSMNYNLNASLESVRVEIATQEAKLRSYVMALENAAAKKENTDMYEKRIQEVTRRINDLKSSKNGSGRRTPGMEREARRKVLGHADIIATTLTSSFMSHISEVFAAKFGKISKFSCCIIDEATQCKEPECLIPLMYSIEKLVMVGDPEQLPATVLSKKAREKSLGQSLFNRIWNKFQGLPENPTVFLNTQYRMHPEIYSWPNTYIYHGEVQTAPYLQRSGPLKPYCVFSLPYQQTNGQSLFNEKEARFVSEIALSIETVLPDIVKSIGIITPYQKQLNMIKTFIEKRKTKISINVNTIDGFQGQESDVIIFSCVRSHGLGFMAESQRLNVALTRARYCMIICGNFKSLQEDKMWSSLLNDAMKRGVVIQTHDKDLSREEILRCILRS